MSKSPRPQIGALILQQASPETKLHIDVEWWEKSDLDLRTYLFTRLNLDEDWSTEVEDQVDLIDAETAEVRRVDGFQYIVQTYFNQLPTDFAQRGSLVDAVFGVLLANGNQPMSIREIAERVQRSPDVVIRTVGGPRVYQGIRPVLEEA